jgi:hypothetical protein
MACVFPDRLVPHFYIFLIAFGWPVGRLLNCAIPFSYPFARSTADNLLLLSCSMPVLSSRVEPRLNWGRTSGCSHM